MKLLILTQKVDSQDPVLGFFHSWIAEFSKYFEKVTVICLYKGQSNLPHNVEVLSLGKEYSQSKIKYLLNFYKYTWSKRSEYDKVFVHMNQIYVLLGGLMWKMLGKDVFLWYLHRSVTVSLRLAVFFVKNVFTATPESFRIKTQKTCVVGHGIDIDLFSFNSNKNLTLESLKTVTVSRISESKDILTILEAMKSTHTKLDVVGDVITDRDRIYFEKVKKYVSENNLSDRVIFHGSKPQREIIPFLQNADLFVHTSNTGSLDKAPLEAMACGTPVISSNDALIPILSPYGLTFKSKDPISLVQALENFMKREDKSEISRKLRDVVVQQHSLKSLILRLSDTIKK